MNKTRSTGRHVIIGAIISGIAAFLVNNAFPHCDTMGGPVITEARSTLEKGDVTPVLKWIKLKDEKEIKSVFAKAIAVRTKGPEEKELADRFFLETLVRLHRAGEGEPYTGIKDDPVEPIVAMADKALTGGSADEIISKFSEHMSTTIRKKFEDVIETQKNKEKSIKEGRKFVESYVTYMHYFEGIHAVIISTGEHHHMNGDESAAHNRVRRRPVRYHSTQSFESGGRSPCTQNQAALPDGRVIPASGGICNNV